MDMPSRYNVLLYVFRGSVSCAGQEIRDGQMAILGAGESVELAQLGEESSEVLLLAGVPIGEPISRWGPFVMNTYGEIREAVADYQAGRMGRISREGVSPADE